MLSQIKFLILNQTHQDPIRSKLFQINDVILYFTEYQITKYFSAMLCQNLVPQNKME